MIKDPIDSLPSLKELLIQHDLWAKKALGQNFLLNPAVTDHIAESARVKDLCVLEIGPGPGGLTRSLLRAGAKKVIAIEKDERCVKLLQSLVTASQGRLTVIEEDALSLQLSDILEHIQEKEIHIVANLPYNIGTELLIQWLKKIEFIPSLTLMFQKEVAKRITAKENSSAYGRLAILAQTFCTGKILFDLDPASFVPAPKVTSSVVQLKRRDDFATFQPLLPFLEKITHAAFGQRRKMLRSSLKSFFSEEALRSLHIDPQARAEALNISQFHQLAASLLNSTKSA